PCCQGLATNSKARVEHGTLASRPQTPFTLVQRDRKHFCWVSPLEAKCSRPTRRAPSTRRSSPPPSQVQEGLQGAVADRRHAEPTQPRPNWRVSFPSPFLARRPAAVPQPIPSLCPAALLMVMCSLALADLHHFGAAGC